MRPPWRDRSYFSLACMCDWNGPAKAEGIQAAMSDKELLLY